MDDNGQDMTESYVEGDNVTYTTGDLETMLDLSRDLVRYYTKKYGEFLHPEKTKEGKGGHLRYRASDIETLRFILMLQKDHSRDEIEEILRDKNVSEIYRKDNSTYSGLIKILLERDKVFFAELTKFLKKLNEDQYIEQQKYLIEQKEDELDLRNAIIKDNELLHEENQKLKEQLDQIQELLFDNKKKKGIFNWLKK